MYNPLKFQYKDYADTEDGRAQYKNCDSLREPMVVRRNQVLDAMVSQAVMMEMKALTGKNQQAAHT